MILGYDQEGNILYTGDTCKVVVFATSEALTAGFPPYGTFVTIKPSGDSNYPIQIGESRRCYLICSSTHLIKIFPEGVKLTGDFEEEKEEEKEKEIVGEG